MKLAEGSPDQKGYKMHDQLTQTTFLRVPSPFAKTLLAELREPGEPLDDDRVPGPEELANDAKLAVAVDAWTRELDGEGDRLLSVPAEMAGWLHEQLDGGEWVFEGMTQRLARGSMEERRLILRALTGWSDVLAQLDEAMTEIMPAREVAT